MWVDGNRYHLNEEKDENKLLSYFFLAATCALAFGFSPTFYGAVFARFMWGLLNGNIGVTKTYLTEISDDTNSAKGMSLYGAIGGFGRTIGPIIGAFLSSPAKNYPKLFQNTIFEKFPYALPCVIVAVNCLVILVIAIFNLPETLSNPPWACCKGGSSPLEGMIINNPVLTSTISRDQHKYDRLNTSDDAEMTDDNTSKVSIEMMRMNDLDEMSSATISASNRISSNDTISSMSNEDITTPIDSGSMMSLSTSSKRQVRFSGIVQVKTIDSPHISYSKLQHKEDPTRAQTALSGTDNGNISLNDINDSQVYALMEGGQCSSNSNNVYSNDIHRSVVYDNGAEELEAERRARESIWSTIFGLLRQSDVLLSTMLYGLISFAVIVINEIFPLWVVMPVKKGGFDLDVHAIGVITTICGVLSIFCQVFLYPMLVDKMGVLEVFQLAVLIHCATSFVTTLLSFVTALRSVAAIWVGLVVDQFIFNVAANWAYISVFVLINNSSYRSQRATVNGDVIRIYTQ